MVEDVGWRGQRWVAMVRERDGNADFQEAGLGQVEFEVARPDELDRRVGHSGG
jgi:hypothetical protein